MAEHMASSAAKQQGGLLCAAQSGARCPEAWNMGGKHVGTHSWPQCGWLFAGLRRTAEHSVRDPEHRLAGAHERRGSVVSTRLHVCLIRQHFIEASVVP